MNYSQNEEQRVILDYFGDKTGVFLDLGCNDCTTFSNTRALALKGWKGVLVDASPNAMAICKELYKGHKGFYLYPFAISDHNGKAILQESGPLCTDKDIGLVSTFHQSEMQRFKTSVKYDPVEVQTFRWKTFLNRLKFKTFDMVSMDIEGSELNVLPEMDLTQTKLICIEHNGRADLKAVYDNYMTGFNVIYTSSENLIYAR